MYMRTIRAMYNKVIHQGIVSADYYPFKKYKIKSQPTAKRAISKDKIKRIRDLELKSDNPLFHARNYFLCSYLKNEWYIISRYGLFKGWFCYRRSNSISEAKNCEVGH